MIRAGVAYYNGFFFPVAIQSRMQVVPVQSSDGWTTKYHRYELIVEFLVHPGCDDWAAGRATPEGSTYTPLFPDSLTDINAAVATLRSRLMQRAGLIQFEGNTFAEALRVRGDLTKRGNLTTVPDVNGGPEPVSFDWQQIGSDKAARIRWAVTVHVACENRSTLPSSVGELSYDVAWSIDESGLTRRTINGQLGVYVARSGNRLTANADQFRSLLNFDVPLGFRRLGQDYQLSSDRRTLTFSVVDAEHPSDSPLPDGIVDADVQVSWTNGGGMRGLDAGTTHWDVTISGTLTVAKGVHRCYAWLAFASIVRNRIQQGNLLARVGEGTQQAGQPVSETSDGAGVKLIYGMDWTEDVFGRSMSFRVSYLLIANMRTVVQATGMWTPAPDASWESYKASHTEQYDTWRQRGHANLELYHDNLLVSFCDQRPSPTALDRPQYAVPQAPFCSNLGDTCPSAKDSWLQFKANAEIIEGTNNVYHMPLRKRDQEVRQDEITKSSTGTNMQYVDDGRSKPLRQSRSTSLYRVRYTGYAMRLGHPIPRPILIEYGGQKAYPVGELEFSQASNSTYEGCPLYVARWKGEYILDGPPRDNLLALKPDPRKLVQ